jgi:hypothetical protein
MGTQVFRQVEALGMAGRLNALTHSERACLYVMAMNAHDTGTSDAPARTYFRGWEHLARVALGRTTYDDAAEHAVKRAIRGLVDAGFVKAKGRRHGERHGNVLYELTL